MRTPSPISTTLDADAAWRLKRRAQAPLDTLEALADRLAEAIRTSRGEVRKVESNGDLTAEAKARGVATWRDDLRGEIDDLDADRLRARRSLDEILAEASGGTGEVNEQLLDELRLQRTWARVQLALDAGGAGAEFEIAKRAAEAGDRMVFRALREEWPAWAATYGVPDRSIEDTLKALDELEAPILSAPERTIRELGERAENADHFARMAVTYARPEVEGKDVSVLPRPDKSVVHIHDEPLQQVA